MPNDKKTNKRLIDECRVTFCNLIEAVSHIEPTARSRAHLLAAQDLLASALRRFNYVEPEKENGDK